MPHDPASMTVTALAAAYRDGSLSPTEATEACLERLAEGPAVRKVTAERARRQARRAERALRAGLDLGPLQGVPVAVKDLIDMEGEVSAAGSAARLRRAPAATADAPILARLDAVGAVFVARTHMTEFAFSGLGVNPHFGTPGAHYDAKRVSGGSSSGSAVVVADGTVPLALGSDTGGSVRIPAAFNRLVGLKTSDGALPMEGTVPLSTTLDTLGPIARTLQDAWIAWRAMRGVAQAPFPHVGAGPLRLLVPETVLHEGLEPEVAEAFEASLESLLLAGHDLEVRPLPELAELMELYPRYGSFAAHEAWALYGDFLDEVGDEVDPRVGDRIRAAAKRPSSDYLRGRYARERLRRSVWEQAAVYDAVLSPTVACLPPRIEDLAPEDAYVRANMLALRNTTVFNLAGGPAVTLPLPAPHNVPVGGSVATAPGREAHALAVAAAWQQALLPLTG